MSDHDKEDTSCGGNSGGIRKHFSQRFHLPPFLGSGPGPGPWVDWLQRALWSYSWPGFVPEPLFVPHVVEHHPNQKITKWRVSLDVAHFAPSEISLSLRDKFLEVKGNHRERPDQHGSIARCFTRKYRLPAEADASRLSSTLSADGILTVEALLPETFVPDAIIIPIKVETELSAEQQLHPEEDEVAEREAGCRRASQHPEVPSSQGGGEEICSDQGQQREEEEEEESVGAADEGLHDSSPEQFEVLRSPESVEMSVESAEEGEVQAAEKALPEEELKGQIEFQNPELEVHTE